MSFGFMTSIYFCLGRHCQVEWPFCAGGSKKKNNKTCSKKQENKIKKRKKKKKKEAHKN